ncbi:MAG: type II toxin-antitoxin system HicB family antitoxin [Armatimonadota bacterium]|nr:type II toxin-antitoxin system HicB family antitoxin [Armatimonadota bacterium]
MTEVRGKSQSRRRVKSVEYVSLAEYIERAMRHARITKDKTGYTATVPFLPGCIACGETEKEALEDLRDAIEAWVLVGLKFGDPIPPIGKAVLAYTTEVDRKK